MNPRAIIRIQLDETAKAGLYELCKQRGMTQISIMTRLVEWFLEQDEMTHTRILGKLSPEALAELTRMHRTAPRARGVVR